MCLVSQNAFCKLDSDVKDWETNDSLLYPEEREEKEVAKESSLLNFKSKKREEVQNEDTNEMEEKKKKKRKKIYKEDSRQMGEEEKELKELESFLFGCLYSPSEFEKGDEEAIAGINSGPLFFTDGFGNGGVKVYEDGNSDTVEAREPAWVDDEEKAIIVNIAKLNRLKKLRTKEDEKLISGLDYVFRSRAQFVKLNPGTEWAQLGALADEKSEGILRTNEDVVVKSNGKLLPGLLEYSRLADVNPEENPFEGPVNSIQFHRNAQLLLATGSDKWLRFFQIDGKRNTEIESKNIFKDCPIRKAAFLPDGSQVIISGRRKFFCAYDLVNAKEDKIGPLVGRDENSLETFEISPDSRTIAFIGNEGYILLVSARTKELIGTLKMNGSVRCLAFADDGRLLISCGGDGHIYHWELRTRRCLHKGIDEGCIMGSSLGASPNGALFAAGSSSGIVNVYNQEDFLGGKRKPLKTIENLTTEVDFVKFNHDAQILAICSSMQKNSLKLVHVPSFSVFSNWPRPRVILHHPRCLDFSPGGGFMAMGNAAGKVFLYKLHHYQRA